MMASTVFLLLLTSHLLGDWAAQSDWQATNKTRSWAALAAHHLLGAGTMAVRHRHAGQGQPSRRGRNDGGVPARSRAGDGARRWWPGLLLVALTVVLAACTSPSAQRSTAGSQQRPAGPRQRDYWPTTGWRTAAPADQGMDPAVLDDLDT